MSRRSFYVHYVGVNLLLSSVTSVMGGGVINFIPDKIYGVAYSRGDLEHENTGLRAGRSRHLLRQLRYARGRALFMLVIIMGSGQTFRISCYPARRTFDQARMPAANR